MKILLIVLLSVVVLSLFAESNGSERTIKEAVVSCIRVVDNGGDYTPNIEVSSRNRYIIKKAIHYYKVISEDGFKVLTSDLVFKK